MSVELLKFQKQRGVFSGYSHMMIKCPRVQFSPKLQSDPSPRPLLTIQHKRVSTLPCILCIFTLLNLLPNIQICKQYSNCDSTKALKNLDILEIALYFLLLFENISGTILSIFDTLLTVLRQIFSHRVFPILPHVCSYL